MSKSILGAATLLLLAGCAGRYETDTRRALHEATEAARAPVSDPPAAGGGSLASYVERALRGRPGLAATLERWRAATHRIDATRRLPEPMITYGFYASPVQTRVGPQRHRLSLRQTVPWPGGVSDAADAQSARARALQRRYEAGALAVRREVADAWWGLWHLRQSRAVLEEQATLVAALAESQRGRLEVGQGTVADLAQVELMQSRLADRIDGLAPQERRLEARLRAVTGLPPSRAVPTDGDAPPPERPDATWAALVEVASDHPRRTELSHRAEAARAQAGVEEARRLPRLTLGADWIETGPAAGPVDGSGQDAVILSVGLSVPIFQDSYEGAQRAAEADARAFDAEGEEAARQIEAELQAALSRIDDSARRIHTRQDTLAPQAEAVYASMLGALADGRAPLAGVLLAIRDRLDIALSTLASHADHGRAWAQLEAVVGRPVPGHVTRGGER